MARWFSWRLIMWPKLYKIYFSKTICRRVAFSSSFCLSGRCWTHPVDPFSTSLLQQVFIIISITIIIILIVIIISVIGVIFIDDHAAQQIVRMDDNLIRTLKITRDIAGEDLLRLVCFFQFVAGCLVCLLHKFFYSGLRYFGQLAQRAPLREKKTPNTLKGLYSIIQQTTLLTFDWI